MRGRCFRLALAARWHFRVLEFVLGVTRRAPRLLDVVFNHRDHRVVGDAALTRTVVVQNVTEPRPALSHKFPGTDSVRRDARKTRKNRPPKPWRRLSAEARSAAADPP